MKLIELIALADCGYMRGYVDNRGENAISSLLDFVNRHTGKPLPTEAQPGGDTLALFVVRELAETFDEDAPDRAQLAEAVRVMELARDDLDNVLATLDKAAFGETPGAFAF